MMKPAVRIGLDILLLAAATAAGFYGLTGLAFITSWDTHLFFESHPAVFVMIRAGFIIAAAGLFAMRKQWTEKPFSFAPDVNLEHRHYWSGAIILTLIYFFSLFIYQIFMHKGFITSLWDLGIYDQVIWNTAYGDFMVTSVRGGLHVFAERFKPILMVLALLYRLQDNVNLLFLVSTLLDSLTILFTFLIAKEILRRDSWAFAAAVCVFFYAPLRNSINFLFHTQTFADPLLLIGFYCALKNRNAAFYFFLLLAMLCKESVIIDSAGLCFFLIYRRDRRGWIGLALTAVMLIIFTRVIEPAFFYEHTFLNKWSYFAHFWDPTIANWNKLLSPNPIFFLFLVGAPFALLPFASSGAFFLLGPSLAFRLLNGYPGFRLTTAHYTAGLNALVIIAFIFGLSRLLKRDIKSETFAKWALVLTAVCFSGLPLMVRFEKAIWEASFPPNQQAAYFMNHIPKTYSVLASESLAAQLSHRSRLYVFGNMWPEAPYQNDLKKPDLIISDITRRQESEMEMLGEYIKTGYRKIAEQQLFEVYSNDTVIGSESRDEIVALFHSAMEIKTVAYRKKARSLYKKLLICTLVLIAAAGAVFCIRRERKRAKPALS